MTTNSEQKKLSRRDFLKIGGLVGVAAQAIAIPALGYKEGKSNDTYTGWEDFEGDTQFFNRKPFELSGIDELYQKYFPKVGETQRPNQATDMPPARSERIGHALANNPDWKPENGRQALVEGAFERIPALARAPKTAQSTLPMPLSRADPVQSRTDPPTGPGSLTPRPPVATHPP